MKSRKPKGIIFLLLLIVIVVFAGSSMVVTKQNQYKLIRQFGRVQRVISQSGLSFKVPFIESVDTIPNQL